MTLDPPPTPLQVCRREGCTRSVTDKRKRGGVPKVYCSRRCATLQQQRAYYERHVELQRMRGRLKWLRRRDAMLAQQHDRYVRMTSADPQLRKRITDRNAIRLALRQIEKFCGAEVADGLRDAVRRGDLGRTEITQLKESARERYHLALREHLEKGVKR